MWRENACMEFFESPGVFPFCKKLRASLKRNWIVRRTFRRKVLYTFCTAEPAPTMEGPPRIMETAVDSGRKLPFHTSTKAVGGKVR